MLALFIWLTTSSSWATPALTVCEQVHSDLLKISDVVSKPNTRQFKANKIQAGLQLLEKIPKFTDKDQQKIDQLLSGGLNKERTGEYFAILGGTDCSIPRQHVLKALVMTAQDQKTPKADREKIQKQLFTHLRSDSRPTFISLMTDLDTLFFANEKKVFNWADEPKARLEQFQNKVRKAMQDFTKEVGPIIQPEEENPDFDRWIEAFRKEQKLLNELRTELRSLLSPIS